MNHPHRNWRKRWPEEAAAFVREQRKRLGMSQAALAAALGYSPDSVESWEQARRVPHPSLRQRLLEMCQ